MFLSIKAKNKLIMVKEIILNIKQNMNPFLDNAQMEILDKVLIKHLEDFETEGIDSIVEDTRFSNNRFTVIYRHESWRIGKSKYF